MRAGLRAAVLGLALFPLGLVLHEVLHLAVLLALGGSGALIVRPWHFQFLDFTLPSLHVTGGSSLDPVRRVLFDLGGPLGAALPMLLLWSRAGDRALRTALVANIAILCFFAAIETADYLLDARLGSDLPMLTWEEFNYAFPVLAILAAAVMAARRRTPRVSRPGL